MRRFEIQEMVSQSQQGVTYLALDKDAQREVALRRFFPFGKDGNGLSAEQQNSYQDTCQRLMRITHTHLRYVVDGGVDSSDNTPYLATEWIEGHSLTQILGGGTLDPARTMDVVRTALQVSLELSEAFGEKAIWIDTDPDSIIVSNEQEGRGYTFWPCPKRWFNTKPKLREVKSIAIMAEALTGWNAQAYSKESGGGFGGWVKTMKSVPCMTVESALDQLNALTSGHKTKPAAKVAVHGKPMPKPVAKPAPKPVARPASAPTPSPAIQTARSPVGAPTTHRATPVPQETKSSSVALKILATVAACLAISSVFGYLVIQNRIKLQNQLAANEAIEKANQAAKGPGADSVEAIPERPQERITKQAKPAINNPAVNNPTPKPVAKDPTPPPPLADDKGPLLTPNDADKARQLTNGTIVRVTGTITSVEQSGVKNDRRYLVSFKENSSTDAIKLKFTDKTFETRLTRHALDKWKGRRFLVEGRLQIDPDKSKPVTILVTNNEQVTKL